MKYLPTLALVGALTFAGCSASPAAAGLKDSCTALGVVLSDFGKVAPTAERYAEYAPKVRAISDAGDAATKTALQPLIAALDKGAQGDVMTALGAQAAATLTLVPQCANAGAPLGAPASSPSASPTPSPTSTLLDTAGFKVALHELGRKCTGSACVVQVRAAVGYTGADDLTATTTVTYKVYGGVEEVARTVTLDADDSAVEEFSVNAAKGSELYAGTSRVEQPL